MRQLLLAMMLLASVVCAQSSAPVAIMGFPNYAQAYPQLEAFGAAADMSDFLLTLNSIWAKTMGFRWVEYIDLTQPMTVSYYAGFDEPLTSLTICSNNLPVVRRLLKSREKTVRGRPVIYSEFQGARLMFTQNRKLWEQRPTKIPEPLAKCPDLFYASCTPETLERMLPVLSLTALDAAPLLPYVSTNVPTQVHVSLSSRAVTYQITGEALDQISLTQLLPREGLFGLLTEGPRAHATDATSGATQPPMRVVNILAEMRKQIQQFGGDEDFERKLPAGEGFTWQPQPVGSAGSADAWILRVPAVDVRAIKDFSNQFSVLRKRLMGTFIMKGKASDTDSLQP